MSSTQSESKGPYTVEQGGGGFYVCGTFPRRLFFRSEDEATSVLNALNLARSNALAAQAERVKELHVAWDRARQIVRDLAYASNSGEDAHCAFCMAFEDTGAHTAGCKMAEAIAEMERIDAALTPPAKGAK